MDDTEFYEFLSAAMANAATSMKDGASFYIWHADTKGQLFRQAVAENLGEIRQVLIWVKNMMVFGRQDYQWKHEPCMYGWKSGAGHYFTTNRTRKTIFEKPLEIDKMSKAEMADLLTTIYNEAEVPTSTIHEDTSRANDLHPTMKPVNLFGRLINNSTKEDWLVLDLFGGSGTTIIACEQLNRRCYTMEYDPQYCDVIIDRWEKWTGKKAEKIWPKTK